MKKYPNKYGEDREPKTQESQEEGMRGLIKSIHESMPDCNEKSFWLVLENGLWNTYADSVKHNCKGELIKEFLV